MYLDCQKSDAVENVDDGKMGGRGKAMERKEVRGREKIMWGR
jgi:hypothetical protein